MVGLLLAAVMLQGATASAVQSAKDLRLERVPYFPADAQPVELPADVLGGGGTGGDQYAALRRHGDLDVNLRGWRDTTGYIMVDSTYTASSEEIIRVIERNFGASPGVPTPVAGDGYLVFNDVFLPGGPGPIDVVSVSDRTRALVVYADGRLALSDTQLADLGRQMHQRLMEKPPSTLARTVITLLLVVAGAALVGGAAGWFASGRRPVLRRV